MFFIIIPLLLFIIVFTFLFICIKSSDNRLEFQTKYNSSHYVLTVKNCEESIEGIIRSAVWQIQTYDTAPDELVVIDLDSEDQTKCILRRLEKEYPFIHSMNKSEYIRFISEL